MSCRVVFGRFCQLLSTGAHHHLAGQSGLVFGHHRCIAKIWQDCPGLVLVCFLCRGFPVSRVSCVEGGKGLEGTPGKVEHSTQAFLQQRGGFGVGCEGTDCTCHTALVASC
jgi:hypothetical protein